jgi:hypothetical protein
MALPAGVPAGAALRDIAGKLLPAEIAHGGQHIARRQVARPEIPFYGGVHQVAAQNVGPRKITPCTDGTGCGRDKAAVPRLSGRLVAAGRGRAHEVTPDGLLVGAVLAASGREQQVQVFEVVLGELPDHLGGVRLEAVSLHLAHGRFHEPGAISDKDLPERLCWGGLTQGQGPQSVYCEISGGETEPDRCAQQEHGTLPRPEAGDEAVDELPVVAFEHLAADVRASCRAGDRDPRH